MEFAAEGGRAVGAVSVTEFIAAGKPLPQRGRELVLRGRCRPCGKGMVL